MKKTGSKRGSGYDNGLGSAVLEAPEESFASETKGSRTEARAPWKGRGPAPAGALQRGYGRDGYDNDGYDGEQYDGLDGRGYPGMGEPEYVPRRGSFRQRFRGLPRSVGGRIALGVVVFVVLGAAAVAVAGVHYYLLHDSRFVVATTDDIQISGAPHLTRDQVLSIFGADLERNIFRTPLAERKADLERLPWVEHATVMRLLPDKIRVQIKERTPVAFVREGTQVGLADASGVLLDMPLDAAGNPHYSFPVLTGLSASDPLSMRAARMGFYEQFVKALDGTGEHLTDSVSEVDVSDPEDLRAVITSGDSDILVHFGQEKFLERYQAFEQHLPEWKLAYPRLASADMRYAGQVVLDMQSGAQAGDGGTVAAAGNATTKATAVATTTTATTTKITATTTATTTKANTTAKANLVNTKLPVAKTPAVKRPAAVKRAVVTRKKSGSSAANEREFAALAAAHKAALAKAAKSGEARGSGTRGSGLGGATE